MIASMHEGFKKIYGFTSNAHKESLWHRYAVSRQDNITDIRLNADIRMISGVLEAFAKQDYLNNPTVALFLSHVGYVKNLKGDSADAMANYLLKEDYKIEMASIIKVLSFLNVLVNVSGKLLSYENDVMSQEKIQKLENHLNEIDEIEKKAQPKAFHDQFDGKHLHPSYMLSLACLWALSTSWINRSVFSPTRPPWPMSSKILQVKG